MIHFAVYLECCHQKSFQQLYGKWQELLNQNEGEVLRKLICIDGKTMRSNKRKEGKPNHIRDNGLE